MASTMSRRTTMAALLGGTLGASMPGRQGWAKDNRANGKASRIVVPFAAGGIADSLGRVVAEILSGSMDQSFVIENWTGAGGNVGAEIVARAAPNGQTLLLGTVGTAVTNQYLYKYISYDCEGSFTPVALVGEVTNALVVHPGFPPRTLMQFIDHCKAREPGTVSYGSPGAGGTGHLFMEYLQMHAGIRLNHVAYEGRSRMIRDLLAGRLQVAMDNLPPYLAHIRSGSLRALGVSAAKRWFSAPDVPTIAEQGYPDYEAALWWYVAAPAGTQRALVRRLSDEIVKGMRSEAAIGKVRRFGVAERPGSADDLARHIAIEQTKWKQVISAAQLQAR